MEGLKRVNELIDAPKAPSGKQDNDFKANDSSLGSKLAKGKSLGWKDFSKNGKLFVNGIDPSDIRQGELGSCYFLAAVAAICMKKPTFLNDRLLTNNDDWYGMRWYVGGKPRDTWVDDKFPTRNGKFRFAHSEKNELWVAVMEKCYAKEHDTYRAIEGGFPGDAMHDITGKPSVSHNLQENWDGENWRVLSECKGDNKIVCAAILGSPFRRMIFFIERPALLIFTCISNALESLLSACGLDCIFDTCDCCFVLTYNFCCLVCNLLDTLCCGFLTTIHVAFCMAFVGLVPGHAYSVLEVKSESCCGISETKMVKLRNPWGKGEWKGAYSDGSCWWSLRPELKKLCNVTDKNDGAFWMSMSDFQKYFDTVDILHYDENYYDTRVEGELKKKSASIKFTVPSACKARVSMTQPRRDLKHRYVFRIGIKSGDKFITRSEYCNFSCNHSTDEVELSAGTYSIQIDGRRNKNLGFKCRVMVSASVPGVVFEGVSGVSSASAPSTPAAPSVPASVVTHSESKSTVNPIVQSSVTTNTATPPHVNASDSTNGANNNDNDDDDDDDDDDSDDNDVEKGKGAGEGKKKKGKGGGKKKGKGKKK